MRRQRGLSPDDVSIYATLACLLEASAPKPGNVAPGRPFRDTTYEDFVVSAVAIGPVLGAAGGVALGRTIREAVRVTRAWTSANTNLGIILLLGPLARAARVGSGTLRERLQSVLAATTVADAHEVYAAIREAEPGGLGEVDAEDVRQAPTVTLLEAMGLAAGRDAIASEYVSGFDLTFGTGLPALRAARHDGLTWPDAVVAAFLALLAARPDTLIARKLGPAEAARISERAGELLRIGGPRTPAGREALAAFDAELRDPQNSRNPGTTADLTAAAVFVALLEDGWQGDRGSRRAQ
ncbi:MAG TPA: triphosphoribosyl-dephospho-CoA synthase [Gemmatimonadales bacterium]|nr:triphosphoribosyl-dephospho-CoA synthase [Gemmatimonadales bacterium]